MSNPVERIKRFIDARTGMRGIDPNIVHSINTNGEQENLTLPDLRALLADLEMAEKALAALAQQAQEPVAWRWMPSQEFPMWVYSDDRGRVMEAQRFMGHGGVVPLFTTTQQVKQAQGPVYQLQLSSGAWIDQSERQYNYNKAHESNVVRILYTAPPAPQVPAPVDEREAFGYIHHYVYRDGTGCIVDSTWEADGCADEMPHPTHPDKWEWERSNPFYTSPPAPQPALVDEQAEFEASMREKHGWVARDFQSDSFGYFDGHTATAWLAWQARAALQSPAPQAGGWLPIEAAPKDGTRLILWWGGKPVFAGWLDNSQCKHPWAGWQTTSLTPRPQGEPTHYMPPPPAPQTKGQP